MTDLGRELSSLIRRAVSALERSAKANEELLELAKREEMIVESGPSICPNCGKLNPEVTQLADEGSGPIDKFVLVCETHCCNHTVYAIPDSFIIVRDKREAENFLEMKGGK